MTITSDEITKIVAFVVVVLGGVHRICVAAERMFPGTRFAQTAEKIDTALGVAEKVTGATS